MVSGVSDAPRPPVQALSARLAGHPVDLSTDRGPAEYRIAPLRDWLRDYLRDYDLAHRVALQLRFVLDVPGTELMSPGEQLADWPEEAGLLDRIDVALQLDETLHGEIAALEAQPDPSGSTAWYSRERVRAVERLDQLLAAGRSPYRVDWTTPPRLIERQDPTVLTSLDDTIATSEPTSARYLRDAWRHAYGLNPDPTAAYREAVRAVEEVACPLVLPKDEAATLGKVVASLQQGGHKWRFVLVARDGSDDVAPLVAMLDRLWTGQVSRHGGGKNSRDQTLEEARAAVHLAATLVQLLSTGALTRRGQA
jgi:hypothetical protein